MAEQAQVHVVPFGEHVFQRDVVDQVLLEVLRRIGVGADLASDDRPHAVAEQALRKAVGVVGALAVGVVLAVGVDAEREIDAFQVVLRPLVELLLDERVERVLRGGFARRSGTRVGVVDQEVHRLRGALFGRERVQFVLQREVLGGREVEAHREVVERVADVDRDVEVHRARILVVRGDVGPDGFDGRDVEGRVGDVPHPLDVAVGGDLEDLLRDDRRIVAHGAAREDVFAREAHVAQRIHRVGQVAAALEVDAVIAAGREVHAGLHVAVDIDVQQHVHTADPDRRGRFGGLLRVEVAERHERHDVLRPLFHLHRRVLHDVADVRAAQQGEAAADDEFVERPPGRGVEIEVGFSVDRGSLLAGDVHELEVGGAQREVGLHPGEVREIDAAPDRQRIFVRSRDRVVVEPHAAVGDADGVGREPERGADHRHADLGLREPHAAVEYQPVGGAPHVHFRPEVAREAEQIFGQKDVDRTQGKPRNRDRQVERAFAVGAVVARDGQRLGAVQQKPCIGPVSPALTVEEPEIEIPETLFCVGELRHRHVAPEAQAVRREVQRHVGAQHAVDGRCRGEQFQHRTDVQSGDVEPDAVGRAGGGDAPQREPLGVVGQVEVGFQPFVEAVDEVVAGIDLPGFEAEERVAGRDARADQAVGPRHVEPEAEPFAARTVLLPEVHRAGVAHQTAVQGGLRHMVEIAGGVRRAEVVGQPFRLLRDAELHGVQHDASRGEPFDAHPERDGLRTVVAAPDFQRFERGFPGFQQVVQDIVPSGCDLQVEVRKHGLQLLHIDLLEADLARQRVGAPGQGRDQRVQRTARREPQRQVAGRRLDPRRGRVGREREAGGADAVGAVAASDHDAVQP